MKQCALWICLCILLLPIQSKAIICSNEDKVRLQALAQNISVSYDYTETNGQISFRAILSNVHEDLTVEDLSTETVYPYKGQELIIPNLKPNTAYRFIIRTEKYFCHHETLYTHYLNTPSYNSYYQDEVCKGFESNALCNKWQKITTSYDEWKKAVEQAKEKKDVIEEQPKKEIQKGIFDFIIEFYLSYYYYLLPLFIVIVLIIMYRYNKKNDLF